MSSASQPAPPPLKVLFSLHDQVETLDITGPIEFLGHAFHDLNYEASPADAKPVFTGTVVAANDLTTTTQKLKLKRDISFTEAYSDLASFDVLVIPGGGSTGVLDNRTEPISLIAAFAALPKRQDGRTRYILSVCTGSLILAEAGILRGLSATTHCDYYDHLRKVCARQEGQETKVLEERFVVNAVDEEKGLRIITSGGVSCGMDASLWLIGEVAGKEVKESVARVIMYAYRDGVIMR